MTLGETREEILTLAKYIYQDQMQFSYPKVVFFLDYDITGTGTDILARLQTWASAAPVG